MELILGAALMFGLIACYVADKKGRGLLAGFSWGFFLGPIGLLVVALQSPNKELLEKRMLVDHTARKCPYCAEVIRAEAVVCRYCGRDL